MVRMRPLLSQEHAITSLTAGGGGNGAGDAPCLRKLMPAESPGQGSIEKSYLVKDAQASSQNHTCSERCQDILARLSMHAVFK